jgi:hypothetical protein
VGRSGYEAGFRAHDTLQNEAVLARENLQDLMLEAMVAKRHAPKVIFVKGGQLLLLVRQGQRARCNHGLLIAASFKRPPRCARSDEKPVNLASAKRFRRLISRRWVRNLLPRIAQSACFGRLPCFGRLRS